jgi:hypothetical protein
MRPAYASAILAIGALCALPAFAADVTKPRSAGALAFGAENVLFVGDTKAGGVHAYEFQAAAFDSQKDVFGGRAETFEGWVLVDKIDRKIAGLLGIDPVDVQINDTFVFE